MASLRSGVVSGGISLVSRIVVQLLLFGVTIVATRALSIAEFGAYSIASLLPILSRSLFYVGPYEFLLKSPDDGELYGSCLAANVLLAVLCMVALGLMQFGARLVFPASEVGSLILMLTPTIVLVAVTSWYEAVLLRAGRVNRYYVNTLVGDVCGAIVAVSCLVRGYGLLSLVLQTYVRLIVLLGMASLAVAHVPRLRARRESVAAILRWSRARYAAVVLNFATAYGADLVLGVMLSPAATGLYRASNRIVSATSELFVQPLQKIAQTNLSARYKLQLDNSTAWLKMLASVGAVAWSALAALALLAQDLVPLALGAKWQAAVPIVVILCAIKTFSLLDAVTTAFLICHDQQRRMLRVQIAAAVSVFFLSAGATWLGPIGVAVVTGAVNIGVSLAYGRMVVNEAGLDRRSAHDFVAASAPPVLAVIACITIFRLAFPQLHGLAAVAGGGVAAAGGFLLATWYVRHRMIEAITWLGDQHEAAPEAVR